MEDMGFDITVGQDGDLSPTINALLCLFTGRFLFPTHTVTSSNPLKSKSSVKAWASFTPRRCLGILTRSSYRRSTSATFLRLPPASR